MIDLYIDPGLRVAGAALFEDGKLVAAALLEGDLGGSMNQISDRAKIIREMVIAASYFSDKLCETRSAVPRKVMIELPQIYKRGHQRSGKQNTDPNDLIHLAAVVGALAVSFPSNQGAVLVLPAEWKGQMPKDIMHTRAAKLLSDAEIEKLPILAKSKFHNVMDAVCMGLVDHGRLKTAGIV